MLLSTSSMVSAKERLIWLLRDLPPLTIFEGSRKGQGAVDQMLVRLIEQMPEYDHSIMRVNRARAMQMLQEPSFTCDATLLWTPERARFIHFSLPSMGTLSNGLIVRRQDAAMVEPFLVDGKVDLKALLASQTARLGMVAERSYSPPVDSLLKATPADSLTPHYGNDAVRSLLQMQSLGRLKWLLGYWPEVRYLTQDLGQPAETLTFYPIQGMADYQFIHVGCSDTPLGREAVSHVNQLLLQMRQDTLPPLYADWLDAQTRETYLRDAAHFFDDDHP
ncbi:TIGR02285 family protein [Pseudomonas sp. zfem002]|uniref:TIGR02285 family protein n=1 Tax=Pseudomonas sp. zfem002 TaxID=3078197 RepID=UPI0029291A2E|nr:TIGR02285 family protein [Pseudomonas sp. zfem002]MDU9389627.1 TIGR02285 family protein [Pseudomonas sp. zfem002]